MPGPYEIGGSALGGLFGGRVGAVGGGIGGGVLGGLGGGAVGTLVEPGGGTIVGGVLGEQAGQAAGVAAGGALGSRAGSAVFGTVGRWVDNKLGYGDQGKCAGHCMSAEKADDEKEKQDDKDKADKSRWSPGKPGDPEKNADDHWDKHQSEFPEYGSSDDYVKGAHDFVDNPPPGTLTKPGQNGGKLMYDPNTNTFSSVDASGNPRTMFRPSGGMSYWNKQ